jgi:putative acetyltransferase
MPWSRTDEHRDKEQKLRLTCRRSRRAASAFSKAPRPDHSEHRIVDFWLRAGKLTISHTEEDGSEIGHVAMYPVSISDGASGWFGLGPILVLQQHQRLGVGSQLVREALRIVREHGTSGGKVLGKPEYCVRCCF